MEYDTVYSGYYGEDKEETRQADDRRIEMKKKLNTVENKLDDEKSKLQELSNMQENVDAIAQNMDKCIELLSKSIQGPTTENMFSDMYASNKKFFTSASSSIETEEMSTRKNIDNLYKEKENLLKEERNTEKDKKDN